VARRPAAVTETTKQLARNLPGPVFKADLICLGCGWEGSVTYQIPRETFTCPKCKRRKAVRDGEADPGGLEPDPGASRA
jgi:hypothetical protein